MRVLITGITGFAGSHLAEYILAEHPDVAVFGTYRWRSRMENLDTLMAKGVLDVIEGRYSTGAGQADQAHKGRVTLLHCELTDAGAVEKLIAATRPDRIFHLAAQSFVQSSFDGPAPWNPLRDQHHRASDRVDRGGTARAGDLPRRPHEQARLDRCPRYGPGVLARARARRGRRGLQRWPRPDLGNRRDALDAAREFDGEDPVSGRPSAPASVGRADPVGRCVQIPARHRLGAEDPLRADS